MNYWYACTIRNLCHATNISAGNQISVRTDDIFSFFASQSIRNFRLINVVSPRRTTTEMGIGNFAQFHPPGSLAANFLVGSAHPVHWKDDKHRDRPLAASAHGREEAPIPPGGSDKPTHHKRYQQTLSQQLHRLCL